MFPGSAAFAAEKKSGTVTIQSLLQSKSAAARNEATAGKGGDKTKADSKTKSKAKSKATSRAKAEGKRGKTRTDDRKNVAGVGKLRTFSSTAGFPKVSNPVETAGAGGGYSGLIKSYATAYGVPADLAHAVVRVESNFNPRARGRAGEVGLMQIKPATARMMGYRGSAKGLYDPETNIKFGMKYLALAHQLGGGTTCGTILKYNAGHGAKRMNPVSKRYCGKVQSIID